MNNAYIHSISSTHKTKLGVSKCAYIDKEINKGFVFKKVVTEKGKVEP
jgi:hypothetical protein